MTDAVNVYIPPSHMHESPVGEYVCFLLIGDKICCKRSRDWFSDLDF